MAKDYFYGLTTDESREERLIIRLFVARVMFLIAFLFLVAVVTKAYAVQLDHQGCQGLAVWSHDIPLMRDFGADKEKVYAYLESNKLRNPMFQILLRHFEKLWGLKEYSGIAQVIYDDCVSRRGEYGSDA